MPEGPRATDWLRLTLPVAAMVALALAAWHFGYFQLGDRQHLNAAAEKVEGTPWLAPIFVAVYASFAALAAPVSPLAYGSGAVFGVLRGSCYVMAASLLGAAAGYHLARTVWAGPAERLLGRFQHRLCDLREGNVFLTVLRLQLLPVVPFGIFNYAAGISRMRFWPFLAGTAVGILPGTVAAVYVGDRLVAGLQGSDRRPLLVAAMVMAALFALSFLPKVIERWIGRHEAAPAKS